jgi:flagellar motility protein MotE (MotC chaperone)
VEKLEGTKERLGDWYNKYFNKEEYQKQQAEKEANKNKKSEKTSRRGFLSKYFHIFNEHPIGVGTTTGIALGGLIKSLKLYPQYIQRKKVAQLKDEHIEYAEKIKILEDYKEQLEEKLKERDNKIDGLKGEIETIKKTLNIKEEKPSKLEKTIDEENFYLPLSMIISGTFLFFAFILLNGINYTGFATLPKESLHPFSILNLLTVIVSFSFIAIGIFKLRKIRKLKHKIEQKKNN